MYDGGFPWLEIYSWASQPSLRGLQTVLTMAVTSRRTLRASVSIKSVCCADLTEACESWGVESHNQRLV